AAGFCANRSLPGRFRYLRHRRGHLALDVPAANPRSAGCAGPCSCPGGGRMKTATSIVAQAPWEVPTRLLDYVELTKPRISAMVLVTVAAGVLLASHGLPDWNILGHTLLGTALVAAGASALNQLLERDSDALMQRTENRPLPAGRLQPLEV